MPSARVLSFRLVVLLGSLALLGAGCAPNVNIAGKKGPQLSVWGVFDDAATLEPVFSAFGKSPTEGKVGVDYRKVSPAGRYEEQLINAIAAGRGPDIFSIHVSWLPRWKHLLLPAPEDLIPLRVVEEEFVQTVAQDLVLDGRVYSLPLFVDSLALYYNRDIFDAAGIPLPPRTWEEVHAVVRQTTKFNAAERGQIDQQGIALGGGRNVNRAADILSALMIQNGAPLIESGASALLHERAAQALQFYTDFANPTKDVYTWKFDSDYSLDAFAEGEATMMINYSYQRPTLRLKNPRLNYAVAQLPQVDPSRPVTYATYWVYVVNRRTANPDVAWKLFRFMTSRNMAAAYLQKSGYPPARRDLVATLTNDKAIGVFAEQSLVARTWKQPDNRVVDRVLADAIDDVLTGRDSLQGALRKAHDQIQAAAAQLQSFLLPLRRRHALVFKP